MRRKNGESNTVLLFSFIKGIVKHTAHTLGIITDKCKVKMVNTYCGVYNVCISKMYDNNSTKNLREEIDVYCCKVLILYMKLYII